MRARNFFSLPPRGARSAFTLLEVLIALAIFALTAIVLGAAYLNILTSYDLVSRQSMTQEDVAFARRLVLSEPDRVKLEKGGDFESTAGRRTQWSVEISPTTMPDLFTVVFTCDITDPARTEPEKVTQTFTVLRPTWSIDAGERDKRRAEARKRIAELQQKKA